MNLTIAVARPHVIPIVESRLTPLVFEVGDLAFNNLDKVAKKDGTALPLGNLQYTLLHALARHAYKGMQHPLSKETLVREVYGANAPKSNSLDVRVWEVRSVLKNADSCILVENCYGRGYRLVVAR